MVSAAALLIAIQFVLGKLYQKKAGSSLSVTLLFNIVNGIVCGLFFFSLNGFRLNLSIYSLWMAILMSVLFFAIGVCNVLVISKGKVSIYSMFSMLGLMLMPFFYGIIFLHESLNVWKILGCIILVISLILPLFERKEGEKKNNRDFFLWCIAVFIFNGVVAIVSKTHQIHPEASGTYDFLTVMYFCSGIISFLFLLIAKIFRNKDRDTDKKYEPKQILLIVIINVGYALVSGVGYLLQLLGAVELDASVLYPIVTGGTIVLSAILGWIFYREKMTVWILVGLILTTGATILFAL